MFETSLLIWDFIIISLSFYHLKHISSILSHEITGKNQITDLITVISLFTGLPKNMIKQYQTGSKPCSRTQTKPVSTIGVDAWIISAVCECMECSTVGVGGTGCYFVLDASLFFTVFCLKIPSNQFQVSAVKS